MIDFLLLLLDNATRKPITSSSAPYAIKNSLNGRRIELSLWGYFGCRPLFFLFSSSFGRLTVVTNQKIKCGPQLSHWEHPCPLVLECHSLRHIHKRNKKEMAIKKGWVLISIFFLGRERGDQHVVGCSCCRGCCGMRRRRRVGEQETGNVNWAPASSSA